jgi:uncharacterized SAM-binding protein YcdF (DUF218 family)
MTIVKHLFELYFLSPEGIMTFLFGVGMVLFLLKRGSKAGPRLLFAGACVYIVVLFTPVADFVAVSLERPFPPFLKAPSTPDVELIVVLGGAGWYDSIMPVRECLEAETTYRVLEGVRLYQQRPQLKLVFSGGTPAGPRHLSIAKLMATYAMSLGVPESNILIEENSKDTHESLVEIRKTVHDGKFIMVTSAYHLRRAMAVARKLGMNPIAAPAWIQGPPDMYRTGFAQLLWSRDTARQVGTARLVRFDLLRQALLEYSGYAWYWGRGWV